MSRPAAFATTYGMAWYPEGSDTMVFVDRVATLNGTAVLSVRTTATEEGEPREKPRLEIAVSKGGRSIRVWLNGKRLVEGVD